MTATLTLAIDASTYVGTVAVLRGSEVVHASEALMRGEREERLMPAVAECLSRARVAVSDLDRVACGAGPGSFTSLRIAASIAKGIALVRGVPLIAVSSLALIVASSRREAGRYLAVLDAMRGDMYAAVVDVDADGQVTDVGPATLVAAADVGAMAHDKSATVIGAGRTIDAAPHARGVSRMGVSMNAGAVSLQQWEPQYGRLAEAQVKWEAKHGRELHSA
jgi:tRNA threonylcarbamoyladenosine biosynthesis protein TsaB